MGSVTEEEDEASKLSLVIGLLIPDLERVIMGCTEWTTSSREDTGEDPEFSDDRSTMEGQCAVSDEGIDDRTVSARWG